MKDGYYKKSHTSWAENHRHMVDYIKDGKTPYGHTINETNAIGFVYEPGYAHTQQELDELLLEAYILGVQGLPFNPSLVVLEKEEEK